MSDTLPSNTVHHTRGCTDPRVGQFRGKHGDLLARCHTCGGRRVLVPANEEQTPEPTEEQEQPVRTGPSLPTGARYTCREHPHRAVTWRGTGCPECKRDRGEDQATRPREDRPMGRLRPLGRYPDPATTEDRE